MKHLDWLYLLICCSARSLTRNPRRTLFSFLAIATATAAIMVFESFSLGVKTTFRRNVITSHYGHFQIFKKGYRDSTSDDPYAYQITNAEELHKEIQKALPNLSFISRRLTFHGLLNHNERSSSGMTIGVDAAEEKKFLARTKAESGKHLADSGKDGLFMGAGLAKKLRVKVGDVVTVLVTTAAGSVNAMDFELTGTFKTGVTELDTAMSFIHLEAAESLVRVQGTPQILLGFDTDDELPLLAPLKSIVAKVDPQLEVVHWKELADFFDNAMGWIEKQIAVFRVVVLIVCTIGILMVFMMSLLERLGEFGTMRAMGTSRADITVMIFAESMIQAFIGSALGLVLGALIIAIGLHNGIVMPPPPTMTEFFFVKFVIPWAVLPNILLVCSLVAGGAGFFPAFKITRANIVQALGRNI